MNDGSRRTSLVVAVIGGVAFVLLAWWLVPWDPVPGSALTPVSASSVFTAQEIERAEEFSRWARVWSWSSLVVSLLVACWFGFTRRGRGLFERLRGPWWLQVLEAVAVLAVVGRLVTLPFAVAQRILYRDYGLTEQAWSGFAVDLVKNELLGIVITAIGVIVVMACARRWQRAWPAVASALLVALVVAGSFVYPVVVEPIFNNFEPLADGPLRTEIFELAEREGVPIDDVLVADASRRTTTLNAYVSGFGSTRRVVVYDNLVDSLPRDQALSVVAHELTHARHKDVVTGTALGAAGALVGIGLLGLLLGALRRRGWPALTDPQAVPVLLALVALATLATAPVQNGISRQIETRADVGALATTEDSAAFIAMQRKLALRSLADPTPPAWSQWWFGSHPTVLKRIALAIRMSGD
jgi:STE24 endopeptidase